MDGNKPRRQSFKAYYLEPKSERGSFVQYMEESGVNAMLIDAVSKLFQVTDKPENPIEWFRLYFRQSEPDRSELLQSSEQSFKDAIIKQESKLTYLRMTESRLKDRLQNLQYEAKQTELQVLKQTEDENFHRYKDHADDFRWRIKPDPSVHVKKADIDIEMVEQGMEGVPGLQKSTMKIESQKVIPSSTSRTGCYVDDPEHNYDDYPLLYFGTEDDRVQDEAGPDRLSSLPPNADASIRSYDGKKSLELAEAEEEFADDEEDFLYEDEQFGNLKSNPAAKRSSGTQQKPPTSIRERKKVKRGSKQHARSSAEELLGEHSAGSAGQTRQGATVTMHHTLDEAEQMGEASSSVPNTGTGDSLGNLKTKGKSKPKSKKSQVLLPLPDDPLALELEPVDPSYWKQDFSVSKGRGTIFEETDEFDFEDDELEEDAEDPGSYLSSRGERRQRKFRSQIISEAFWKPDRGRSIQFDSKFDLADVPNLSSHVSGIFVPQVENLYSPKSYSPSHVSAVASDASIRNISATIDGP